MYEIGLLKEQPGWCVLAIDQYITDVRPIIPEEDGPLWYYVRFDDFGLKEGNYFPVPVLEGSLRFVEMEQRTTGQPRYVFEVTSFKCPETGEAEPGGWCRYCASPEAYDLFRPLMKNGEVTGRFTFDVFDNLVSIVPLGDREWVPITEKALIDSYYEAIKVKELDDDWPGDEGSSLRGDDIPDEYDMGDD